MDSQHNYIWDQYYWRFLDDEEENSAENGVLILTRRQYKMRVRINIDNWDDLDFFMRFRLQKSTVMMILDMIQSSLEVDETR